MKKRDDEKAGAVETMSIGDALRVVGFGETSVAVKFRNLVGKLTEKNTGDPKLLLETLKECGKYLEASHVRGRLAAEYEDGPVSVELVHNVARPTREKNRGGEKQIGFQFEKETL